MHACLFGRYLSIQRAGWPKLVRMLWPVGSARWSRRFLKGPSAVMTACAPYPKTAHGKADQWRVEIFNDADRHAVTIHHCMYHIPIPASMARRPFFSSFVLRSFMAASVFPRLKRLKNWPPAVTKQNFNSVS